ncbi:hypothetical protein NP493_434g00008 [Ridgeia piscesae]|uniref:Major facilitator superfamily (MFS) profile domain-containing protein n=1 Tax=Ridgeia piscesae TaxID=27915 RepID=A0AAD9KZN0_RIDPI|nr:hypothetical protein NP493_434g00008 [Ridgeia piscesae]
MEEGTNRDDSREISDLGEGDRLLDPVSYPETQSPGYRVYKKRWLILAVVALLNVSNGMLWITFSPIADVTAAYYGVGDMAVNWLSLIFLVVCIPLGLVAAWLLDTLGLRTGIVLAAWVNIAGSVLRVVSCLPMSHDHRFALVLSGQALAACAQPFMLFAPTKVAAVWFKDTQRATANMIASIANPVGILLANLISPAVVGDSPKPDLLHLMLIYTIPATIVVVIATFGVCSSVPPTPPTASAAETSQPFFKGLKMIACRRSYWILAVCFGTGLALFTTLSTLLQQILCPRGYSDSFAGLCGALLFGVGVVGAGLASLFVDRTRKFEEVAKISFALAALCCVGFMVLARYQAHPVLMAVVIALLGFFGFALYPVCLELSVESTYPVAEATSAGFLIISGQIQGILYILVMEMLARPIGPNSALSHDHSLEKVKPEDYTMSDIAFCSVAVLASLVFMFFFKCDYLRMKAEQEAAAEEILNASLHHRRYVFS